MRGSVQRGRTIPKRWTFSYALPFWWFAWWHVVSASRVPNRFGTATLVTFLDEAPIILWSPRNLCALPSAPRFADIGLHRARRDNEWDQDYGDGEREHDHCAGVGGFHLSSFALIVIAAGVGSSRTLALSGTQCVLVISGRSPS